VLTAMALGQQLLDKLEQTLQPIFRRREGAVLIDGKPARGSRLPIHPPRHHPGLECRFEGRDQVLKLVKRHAREIQKRYWARLQLGKS